MMLNDMLNTYDRHLTKINLNKSALWIVRDLESYPLKKERFLECFFRAPLFLGKWCGVTTYFLYKKIRKNKYKLHAQNTSAIID